MMINTSGTLKNYWYAAAQSKQIQKNKPYRCSIFDLPIVIWRTSQGLTALLDRCAHRNAPLSYGKVIKENIICPYHGWTFNANGECVNIPSEGESKAATISNKSIETFPVKEQDDLIWVWMGREQEVDKEPFQMPIVKRKGWHYYYMETMFDNNVTDLVENFMDVPHTVFVHKGWFRDKKQIKVPMLVERTEDSVLVTYQQENDSIGAFNWLVNPKGLPMKHTDNFYMPNNTKVDYIFGEEERGFIISSTCTPIKPFQTKVFTLICYKFGWMTPLAKLFLPAYTRKVIEQDVWIMDIQGKNLQTFEQPVYKSTQADTLHLYIESLRNWEEKGGTGSQPKPIKKECEFWI